MLINPGNTCSTADGEVLLRFCLGNFYFPITTKFNSFLFYIFVSYLVVKMVPGEFWQTGSLFIAVACDLR